MNRRNLNRALLLGLAALLLTVFALGILIIVYPKRNLLFLILSFLICLLILYYFLTKNWVSKKISSEVSQILKEGPFEIPENSETVTTDMEALSREVKRFTRDKMKEIEGLTNRENYRREFMGNISHELKTPLFTVQGYIHTLIDGAKDDEVFLDKYLDGAAKGVERLVRLVGDMDMITELESGKLSLNNCSFNLVDLIQNVLELLQIKADKKNITLTLDNVYSQPVVAFGDKERIEQVLINIVENSIKYGKKNGTTEVAVEPLSEIKILVRITDNGEGVSKENLARLFERFYRIDKSGSRKEGGSGLGLSIVKHIIEAHNEKIYVESQLGVGSEFSFTIQKSQN